MHSHSVGKNLTPPSATAGACPICGASSKPYCDKSAHGGVWHVLKCVNCGHGFVGNPPPLERLEEIQSQLEAHTGDSGGGQRLAPPSADAENVFFARRIARLTSGRGKTLDVGSGGGSSSLCLSHHGFGPLLLIDFDPRAAGAVEHIPNSRFERRAFESLTADEGPFDVIVMSHVLEHSMEPLQWLTHARTLLSPAGVLGIAVPNFGGVYKLLGERDPWIIPPIHLQYFTPASLRQALEKSGLKVLKMRSRSGITLDPVDRKLSLKSKLLRSTWNIFAAALNRTTRGIVLQAYAGRAEAGASPSAPRRQTVIHSLEERLSP